MFDFTYKVYIRFKQPFNSGGRKRLSWEGDFFLGVSIFSSQGELREIDVEGKEKGKVRFLVPGEGGRPTCDGRIP